MYLGIEIGGTKLQLAVGPGDGGAFVGFERRDINIARGADGILEQIREAGTKLLEAHEVKRVGIGFGGPVDHCAGRVITSHQVDGWDNLSLTAWCQQNLNVPAVLGNDCDCAALAEARFGAGQGSQTVFFVTVGTGIGGALVIGGELHGQRRPAVAEIGHLRPGVSADSPAATVESYASGPGIVASVQTHLGQDGVDDEERNQLLERCGGDLDRLTAKSVAELAAEGNLVARTALVSASIVLGWAIAQIIAITAADTVVVGGGVSLIGDERFFQPLRAEVARYVFPPLLEAYQIVPAAMGEAVVAHGALALAAMSERESK
ncbi:MAG TPA: ROK family protein [Pirellulaceae bacterium]|nr:ROK family protein [Pirellulaceae bacterium]